ncbi:DUF4124 domain-containing protein [Vibrio astriarenae]
MRISLFLFTAFISVCSMADQTVYTWVDAQGVLHFSDTPTDVSAETLSLPSYSVTSPVPVDEPNQSTEQQSEKQGQQTVAGSPAAEPQNKIEPLTIHFLSPTDNQTIRSNRGLISIQSQLTRKLAIGETLQLFMNNKPYGAPSHKPLWELKNIDRGSHEFTVKALKGGKVIASSSSITVHLHRASIK